MTPLDEQICLGGLDTPVISAHLTAKNIVTVEIKRRRGFWRKWAVEKYEIRLVPTLPERWVWARTNLPITLFTKPAMGALEAALTESSIFEEK